MGTRNLTVVVLGGEYRVAQYGQWDGYPSGQGETISKFIRKNMKIRNFKKAVKNCRFLTKEELDSEWSTLVGKGDGSGFYTSEQVRPFYNKYPQFSRDNGAEILYLIQNSNGLPLKNDLEFAGDSLFCEFAYVIDLDKKVLEVYKGFNKTPLTKKDRFFTIPPAKNGKGEVSEYHQVKLFAKYKFDKLTEKTMKNLEKKMYKEDEE